MSSVIADTHAIIWYLFDQNKLSKTAFDALDQSINQGGQIYISSISLIEIIYLVEKGDYQQKPPPNSLKPYKIPKWASNSSP